MKVSPKAEGGKSMKKHRAVLISMIVLALGPAAASLDCAAPPKGPAYRTVHVFSPGSVHDEKLMLSLLQEFSATVARLGASEVSYRLWKAEGGTKGEKTELMYESTWPSREVYDRVHKEAEYVKLLQKYLPFLRRVLKGEVYTAYVEIEPGPAAGGGER
jgi:hypothetical protein